MDGQTPNLHIFRCVTGLRGYHVYQVDWKPILGREIVSISVSAVFDIRDLLMDDRLIQLVLATHSLNWYLQLYQCLPSYTRLIIHVMLCKNLSVCLLY